MDTITRYSIIFISLLMVGIVLKLGVTVSQVIAIAILSGLVTAYSQWRSK